MAPAPRSLACVAAAAAALTAQAPPPAPPKTELELDKQVTAVLVTWARMAESLKLPSRARAVYEQILDHYDVDQPTARAGLGYKRVKGEWQQVTPRDKLPADAGTPAQRKTLADAWAVASRRVAKLHADLGHVLRASGDQARARYQLERAVVFAPDDVALHQALGHEQFDGFHGTAAQIELVKRMRAVFAKAREVAAMDVDVEPVASESAPRELRGVGVPFTGAKSKTVTYWVAGGEPEEAANCVRWHERSLALLQHLLGDDPEVRRHFKPQPVRWVAVLRDDAQRRLLLETCPAARDGETIERAQMFGGQNFAVAGGRAEWVLRRKSDDLANDADHAVALVTKRGTPWFNSGLSEGLVHTMTWLLCGTLDTWYMLLPTTASGEREPHVREPEPWLRQLRDEIDAGTDWPLLQLPRERMENFRMPVRIKSWSFVTWLLARHPDRWPVLLRELRADPLLPEDVAEIVGRVLEQPIGEVEAEWREWARRDSRLGRASRLPQ
jgi:hypothetical protein